MFALSGTYSDVVIPFFEAIKDVSQEDPMYDPDVAITVKSHADGWGYAFSDGNLLEAKKYSSPVFESTNTTFPSGGKLIVHSRKADKGEHIGLASSHPYHRSDTQEEVYFAHNGTYNKEKILASLNMKSAGRMTDSEVFLEYVMSREGTIKDKVTAAIEDSGRLDFVKTTGNFFMISVDRESGNTTLFYYAYDTVGYDYTDLYIAQGKGWKGVFSSSLPKSASFPGDLKLSKVGSDTLNVL